MSLEGGPPEGGVAGTDGEVGETPSLLSAGQSSSELSSPVIVELCEVEEDEGERRKEEADESAHHRLHEEDCSDPELEELLDSELEVWRASIRVTPFPAGIIVTLCSHVVYATCMFGLVDLL